MVVNTSAVVAGLIGEPDAGRFQAALMAAPICRMSAVNVFECRLVLGSRFGDGMLREFELLLAKLPVVIDPFDGEAAVLAYEAHRRFGKGTGRPVRLNLGDCAAYALARSRGLPVLFKGDDFAKTDIEPALR